MQALQIKILNKEKLFIKWDDETESAISLKYLRDECPCADCKGETILFKTYRPPKRQSSNPDMYRIKGIDTVGGYAIQITWKDNHDTGIFSWEYLKKLDTDQNNNTTQNYSDII